MNDIIEYLVKHSFPCLADLNIPLLGLIIF